MDAQKFELGEVSIEELKEKHHATDTSAVASVLYAKGRTYFAYSNSNGFSIITEVETRIKIYKKEGYEYANKAVEYFTGSSPFEKVSFSKAVTYNLVDGKIDKSKLKSDGEFTEKSNKFWSLAKVTMPNVKEGSVIEYKYTISSPYTSTFPEWKFQSDIPVNYSEYETDIPEYYTYNTFFKGFLAPTTTKSISRKSIEINSKERSGLRIPQANFSNTKIEYVSNGVKYVMKDIPAIKDEAFVNNIDNYSSSVFHEKASQQFPNSYAELFATDWETIVKAIYERDDFGGELNKKGYFEDDLSVVLAGVTDTNQKLNKIFQYVKERMNWDKYTGYSCNDGVKTAYKQKTGNIAEINLMLASMLQSSGFQAMPVLVSTRANGVAIFPNKSAYNYVVVAVEDNNKIVLLDATDKYALPNQIPFRALNWFGRLIRKDGSSTTIDLMPKEASNENVMMNYSITKEGKVTGKIRRQYSDYNAQLFRNNYVGLKEEQYIEKLENDLNKIEISEYERANAIDISKPIQETFSFTGTNFCDVVGDKIYVAPMLFLGSKKNPFNQEKREYPVDFGFPFQDKYTINIEIPEGYAVESLPAATSIQTEQNICSFKYIILQNGNKVQISIVQDVSVPIVNPVDYPLLKESYKKLIEKETEKIVLKKL